MINWSPTNLCVLSPSLALSFPVGKHMSAGDSSIKVELKSWFTWDSLGNASTTAFEVTSMSMTGGYEIEWDEDPVCLPVGDQSLDRRRRRTHLAILISLHG